MYEKTYGFLENPFSLTPDPKFFFPSPKHTDALNSLIYTITEKRGFAVITGDIGCGKTTVCRTLLNRLDSGTKVAMLTNPPSTPQQLLSSILEDLGVALDAAGPMPNLLSCLKKYLIEQSFLDFNVVLIIDEAQNLTPRILEEIRLLSNLETEKKKMLQIILTGHPELKDKLKLKELTQLRQRVNVKYHILPLDRADTENYIHHRLRVCSINGNIQVEFTPEALDEIYSYSRGIPRIINMLCNNALLIGYVTETKQITPQIIREAKEEFGDEVKTAFQESDLTEKKTALEELSWQFKSTQEALSNCECTFQEKKLQLKDLTQVLQVKQSAWEELNRNFIQLKEELKNLQTQKHKSQQEQEGLSQNWLNLQAQRQKEQEELLAKVKFSQEELNTKESQLQAAESRLQQLNAQLNQLRKEKEEAQAEQTNLNQEWQKRQEELSSLLKSNQEKLALQESNLAEKKTALEELSWQFKSTQETLSNCECTFQEKKLQLKDLTQVLQAKESLLEGLKQNINQLDERLRYLLEEKAKSEQEQKQLNQTYLSLQTKWQKEQEKVLTQLKVGQDKLKLCASEIDKTQEKLALQESNLAKKKSALEEIATQLNNADKELRSKGLGVKEIENKLSQLNKDLDRVKQEKEKLQSELKELNCNIAQLKEELKNLQTQKHKSQQEQEELTQNWLNLQAQRQKEQEELLAKVKFSQEGLNTKEFQLQTAESRLLQLNAQLNQLRKDKEETQAKQDKLNEEYKVNQEKLALQESNLSEKKAVLEQINGRLESAKEELKNLQEQKLRCQKEQEKLNQSWLDHRQEWHQKENEILGQFKSVLLNKPSEKPAQAGPNLEKLSVGLAEKPVIKLKAKHPKAEAAVLTASTSNGEIKINPADKDDYLNSVYNAIQIFHLSKDMRNYKNLNFCAKVNRKRDYPLFFNLELKNGPGKIGKHYKVEVADSWQKVIIPLGEFNRITRLDSVTEVNLFIDYDIDDTDGVTYINDICFSH